MGGLLDSDVRSPDVPVLTDTRRRRPRRGIALLAGLAMFGGGVVTGWLLHQEDGPGRVALSTSVFGYRTDNFVNLGDYTAPSGDSFTAYEITYRDGAPVEYVFDLANRGTEPIRVLDINPGPWREGDGLMRVTRIDISRQPTRTGTPSEEDIVRFEPFSLEPEEGRMVVVHAVLEGCDHFGEGAFVTIPTQWIVLDDDGQRRRVYHDIGAVFEIHAPPESECPGRR